MSTQRITLRDFHDGCIGGRYRKHGPASAEEIRDDHIIPVLEAGDNVVVDLRGIEGFPTSALEECFGGLVRKLGADVVPRVSFDAEPGWGRYTVDKARQFMREQVARDEVGS